MRRVRPLAAALVLLLLGAAPDAGAPAVPAVPDLTVFVAADVRGYLGPCGCSENMRGGIARAAHQVLEARRQQPKVVFLDAGDSLFGKLELTKEAIPQEVRKAKALAEAFRLMGLAARVAGEKDRGPDASTRKALGLPELEPGEVKRLSAGERELTVIAASDAATLRAGAKKAKGAKGAFVVALFHGTRDQARAAAKGLEGQVHLVVASHATGEFDGEESRLEKGEVPLATVQSKGRSLLRLDVWFGKDARFELLSTQADVERTLAALDARMELLNKQINHPGLSAEARAMRQAKLEELFARRAALQRQGVPSPGEKDAFSVTFVPLEATLPSAPAATAIVDAYDREVGLLNLQWAKKHGKDCPKPKRGEAAFVGNGPCRECHEEAFPVWERSRHAHGYETLVDRGKQHHLDCVGCHVTGFGKPGGVCRVDRVEGREGVGCESCHGPGSIHAEDPSDTNISRGAAKELCVRCHDPENSPHFDFNTYLPEILGPGHGRD